MEGLQFERAPKTDKALLVIAFQDWTNAGDAPVTSIEYLKERFGANRFAWFPPEGFFQYSCGRPMIRYADYEIQEFHMPRFEFFECAGFWNRGGLIVGVGSEPNLRWEPFCQGVLTLIRHCRVTKTILLGTQMVPRLHTEPIRIEGAAAEPDDMRELVPPRSYKGPAGVIDALFHRLCQEQLSATALWAEIPNYLPHLRNPRAVHSLLSLVGKIAGVEFDLSELSGVFEDFDEEVEKVIANDGRIAAFVRKLQRQQVRTTREPAAGWTNDDSAGGLAEQIEDFLRTNRGSISDENGE